MQDRTASTTELELRVARAPAVLPLRFEKVSCAAGSTQVLSDVNLELRLGGATIVMGPNGSGKTTLLRLSAGLLAPDAGTITFARRPRAPSGSISILFQKPVMLRRSTAANITYALEAAGKPSSPSDVQRLLDLARISALADRPARKLSGGEQQRLALARALAREPQILLLDEPTASLDPAATKLVEEIIARVAASGVKIVMSTHDLGQARRLASDVVFLAKGRMFEHAPAERFFTSPASDEARRFLAGELVM